MALKYHNSVQVEDTLHLYLRRAEEYPLLTAEEERETARLVREGTPQEQSEAKEKMIRSNLKLVVAVAGSYQNHGVPMLDLIQEGNHGLMTAVEKFDYRRGNRFSTYAYPWIQQHIQRAVQNDSRTVRLPVYQQELLRRMKTQEETCRKEYGREPSLQELAGMLDLAPEKTAELKLMAQEIVSMDAPAKAMEDMDVREVLADDHAVSPEKFTEQSILHDTIQDALQKQLDEREMKVIAWRFGLNPGSGTCTLEEAGNRLGITRERVRQIETGALHKLRRNRDLQCFMQ